MSRLRPPPRGRYTGREFCTQLGCDLAEGSVSNPDELQERICRACNTTYRYPVLRSLATRFYCESCATLPAGVRNAFEQMNKRIKNLTSAVEKLSREKRS
jgi:hypothetical protein